MKNKLDCQILVVDDERLIRESLYETLKIDGYKVSMAATAEEALKVVAQQRIDIILTDFRLPMMSGIDLLERVKQKDPDIEVIMITGYGSIEMAVQAMKKGASDYITKPINDYEIKVVLDKIIEKRRLINENIDLKKIIEKELPNSFCGMIGASEKMHKVYHMISSVANSNATILITGESGTGKSLAAKAIHQSDEKRKEKPFVEISCGALSETLLESELFGHVKGAFTGAIKDKPGRFEYAEGGTIFLDEIDAFSPNLQVKLLRVLQDGVFERVGDNVPRKAAARVIVATNRHLPELVKKGGFREDLYYRVNVISINMPPLRERKEDIPLMADFFVKRYAAENNKNIEDISEELKDILTQYRWPGNIRELENAMAGAVIMAKSNVIDITDMPNVDKFRSGADVLSEEKNLKKVTEQPEKEHIIAVLKDCRWNRNKAAEALGVNRTTLYNKMKKYDIKDPD